LFVGFSTKIRIIIVIITIKTEKAIISIYNVSAPKKSLPPFHKRCLKNNTGWKKYKKEIIVALVSQSMRKKGRITL